MFHILHMIFSFAHFGPLLKAIAGFVFAFLHIGLCLQLDCFTVGFHICVRSYAQSVLCLSTDLTGLNVVGNQLQYNYIDIFDYNAPEAFTPIDLFNVATVRKPDSFCLERFGGLSY
jgi:hypothetical protein